VQAAAIAAQAMRAKEVRADTLFVKKSSNYPVWFTMNITPSLEMHQKDKTLGEPPLGPG
jgi:hypothetical protein